MRILYISSATLPSQISNSLSIMNMCQAFAGCGHEVYLTGYRTRRRPEDIYEYYGMGNDFTVRTFHYGKISTRLRLRELFYARDVVPIIQKVRPDLIYSRLTVTGLRKIPSEIPLVFEMHSPGPIARSTFHRSSFESLLEKKNFKRIVVTSLALHKFLSEIYPGFDVIVARLSAEKPIPIDGESLGAFRRDRLKGSSTFKVGYTGFLDNTGLRGIELLCKLADRMRHTDFHVIGGTEVMLRYWSERKTSENIYFHGYRKASLIPWYLKSFDVVVAPLQRKKSSSKPLGKGMSPLKIPQYLAYGCVIAASDVPPHLEILKHGESAMICEADNVDHWVSTLEQLRMNEGLRHTLSSNAYRSYLNEFTPEIRVKKILSGLRL